MTRRMKVFVVTVAFATALDVAWLLAQSGVSEQLEFSTYFGGTAAETVTAVRVDANGNVYLAGSTRSPDLATRGSLFSPPATIGLPVGFLTKLRPDRSILYSTFLERPVVALAVDSAGNAIVVDHLPAGSKFTGPIDDVVVSKMDANGTAMVYSVRLGGSRLDRAAAVAADHTGAVVVTGQTNSPDFPLLNALQPTVHTSGSTSGPGSAFITKLDAQGHLVFSTGWGGSGEDAGTGVAIDRSLDIVVTGTTASTDFVTTTNAFQRTLASTGCSANSLPCRDAFISRLSPDGQSVRYSTLFGGSNGETVQALAIDHLGSPHIAGATASSDLPLRRALQTMCDSAQTVNGCSSYVAKLSPDGSSH
jgi:hypothetical protein